MRLHAILIAALFLAASPAAAQLGLPGVGLPLPGKVLDPLANTLQGVETQVTGNARGLLHLRERRLARFLRHNRRYVAPDANGDPARRGELLVMQFDKSDLARLEAAGFSLIGEETVPGLGLRVARIATPRRTSLAKAQRRLSALLPKATVSADPIYFKSGAKSGSTPAPSRPSAFPAISTPVGMIDGAPSPVIGPITVRGFASGAPHPSNHGSEVAWLLRYAGARRIRAADVYGTDPAGGNALAIVRGLGWLVDAGSKVVSISLVGPPNPLLARAVAAAQAKGVVLVAAVGNDGPAAPPAYPASYPKVVAVTAVDGHRRPLIEDGHALHVDYAAPGADIYGRDATGKLVRLRGTSFATPLVAARAASALGHGRDWRTILDREAIDLGKPGPDPVFGHGLLCASCTGK